MACTCSSTGGIALLSPQPLRGECRTRWIVPLLIVGTAVAARPAAAAPQHRLPAGQLSYRGGPLLANVKVATLYWGSNWSSSSLTGYFNSFYRSLFADGRFMANLAQYSAGNTAIGNGSFIGSDTDTQAPAAKVTDAQIRTEIHAQVAAGKLPAPDENTVYFVYTPPGSVVYDRYGENSANDFVSYHDYEFGSDGFAYAVVAYDDTLRDPRIMTVYASHELAEAVTDPEPSDNTLGWYDDNYGEIGDIPPTLYEANQISIDDLVDQLNATDGTPYLVQKVWSLKDSAPVAFAD